MKRTLVVAGSGTGGHIRPLLGVVSEIKKQDKDVYVVYVGQKGDRFADLVKDNPDIDKIKLIRAGKFRRYHGLGLRQFLHLPTLLRNLRDSIYVVIGLAQACLLMRRLKPKAVFIKGGFIGVPVGLAAARRKIPIVTHDSDAMPGLANRLIAKWVDTHAVALPVETYDYPEDDTINVGVPLAEDFYNSSEISKQDARKTLELTDKKTVLFLGGSLGAKRMNNAIKAELENLQELAQVVHVTGDNNFVDFAELESDNYHPIAFIKENMHLYLIAADVVVSRAGATAMAEIAAVGRPVLLIPNPQLTGGHQIHNAKIFSSDGAGVYIEEDQLSDDTAKLSETVKELLAYNESEIKDMTESQAKLVNKNSSKDLAKLVIEAMGRGPHYGKKRK